LNFKFILGVIGTVLIACNILFFVHWVIPLRFIVFWALDVFQDIAILYGLFLSTIIAGFALYIIGRKEFSNRVKGNKIAFGLLMFLGFILAATSFTFLSMGTSIASSDWGALRSSKDWATFLLLSVWSGLGVISGILWLIDGANLVEDKVLLSKKSDFSQTRYPKDLIAKYVKQYPHNPTGVLEWHIHKKMKESKTRGQTIEELIKESE